MKKVTSENCRALLQESLTNDGNVEAQAKAWMIVYRFCLENGMQKRWDKLQANSGIEKVISFLEYKFKVK